MHKIWIVGAVAGAIAVSAAGAIAGYHMVDTPREAKVVSAKPVMKTVRTARQACHTEPVVRRKPLSDQHQLAGTGIGAVVGGLLGNRVGGGSGKVLATVAGAAAGGYAGNRIEDKVQQGETYTTAEQRCTTVYDTKQTLSGYDIEYVFAGEHHHAHLDHDPGPSLPVKDGKVITAI